MSALGRRQALLNYLCMYTVKGILSVRYRPIADAQKSPFTAQPIAGIVSDASAWSARVTGGNIGNTVAVNL